MDNDGLHSNRERSGSIVLSPGFHHIYVPFFEATIHASLSVKYKYEAPSGSGYLPKQLVTEVYHADGECH